MLLLLRFPFPLSLDVTVGQEFLLLLELAELAKQDLVALVRGGDQRLVRFLLVPVTRQRRSGVSVAEAGLFQAPQDALELLELKRYASSLLGQLGPALVDFVAPSDKLLVQA